MSSLRTTWLLIFYKFSLNFSFQFPSIVLFILFCRWVAFLIHMSLLKRTTCFVTRSLLRKSCALHCHQSNMAGHQGGRTGEVGRQKKAKRAKKSQERPAVDNTPFLCPWNAILKLKGKEEIGVGNGNWKRYLCAGQREQLWRKKKLESRCLRDIGI